MLRIISRIFLWCIVGWVLLLATADHPGQLPAKFEYGDAWVQPPSVGGVTVAFKRGLLAEPTGGAQSEGWVDEDAARIHLTETFYFVGNLLEPGDYKFGLYFDGNAYRWLSQTEGFKLDWALNVRAYTDEHPIVDLSWRKGAIEFSVAYAETKSWGRFIPAERHARLVEGMTIYKGRSLTIHSDATQTRQIKALLELGENALDLYEIWSGNKPPAEPLVAYIFADKSAFGRVGQLLHRTSTEQFGGFVSPVTGHAYMPTRMRNERNVWKHNEIPVQLAQIFLHELNHAQLQQASSYYGAWPTWLVEGIAESFSHAALRVLKFPGISEYETSWQQQFKSAMNYSRIPHPQDFFGGSWSVEQMYPCARAVVDDFSKYSHSETIALMRSVDIPAPEYAMHELAMSILNTGSVSGSARLERAVQSRMPDANEPAWEGFWVRRNGAFLLLPPELGYTAIRTGRAANARQHIDFECSFIESGDLQFDVTIGSAGGKDVGFSLKLAIQPEGASLMYVRFGEWYTIEYQEFETPLAIGKVDNPNWHKMKVTHDPKNSRIDFSRDGLFSLQFDVPVWVQREFEDCGVGTYNSAGLLRNISFKAE